MSDIPPSMPLRLAATYGTGPVAKPAQGNQRSGTAGLPSKARGLVAATLSRTPAADGYIEARPLASGHDDPLRPLQMYQNPAERNAVATAVEAGRRIDVTA